MIVPGWWKRRGDYHKYDNSSGRSLCGKSYIANYYSYIKWYYLLNFEKSVCCENCQRLTLLEELGE